MNNTYSILIGIILIVNFAGCQGKSKTGEINPINRASDYYAEGVAIYNKFKQITPSRINPIAIHYIRGRGKTFREWMLVSKNMDAAVIYDRSYGAAEEYTAILENDMVLAIKKVMEMDCGDHKALGWTMVGGMALRLKYYSEIDQSVKIIELPERWEEEAKECCHELYNLQSIIQNRFLRIGG